MSSLRLLANSASGAVLLVVEVLITFFVTPIYLHRLGTEAYGAWELVIAFIGNVSLLELGFGQASTRGIADAIGRQDHAYLVATVSNCVAALLALGVIGCLIVLATVPWADELLNVGPTVAAVAGVVMVMGAVQVLLRFAITSCVSICYGLQLHSMVNAVRIALLTISSTVAVAIIPADPAKGLFWMAFVATAGVAVQLAFILFFLIRRIGVAFDWASVSKGTLREFWLYGARSSVIQGAGTMMRNFTPFTVAHAIGTASVPFLTIANRLADYVFALGSALGMPLTPYLAEIEGRVGGGQRFRSAYMSSTRILMCFAFGFPMGLFFFGTDVVRLWLGNDIATNVNAPLKVLCVALLFQAAATNAFRVLLVRNAHAPVARAAAVCALVFGALCWFVSGWLGVVGVAAAWGGYQLVMAVVELTTCCRVTGWSLGSLLRDTAARYVTPVTMLGAAAMLMSWLCPPATWGRLAVDVAVAGTIYLLAVWAFALSRDDKSALSRLFARTVN